MATDFLRSDMGEPHASRRRQILSQYPQIKQLFGPDPFAFLKISAVVVIQLLTAVSLKDASSAKIIAVAYFFGSFMNHNMFLAIHELSHNLGSRSPPLNRLLGILANLPVGVPMSVPFQKYQHYHSQGADSLDMDVPSRLEARWVPPSGPRPKSAWLALQLLFYALHPLLLKPKPPGPWELANAAAQLALDAALVYLGGWASLAYLLLSTLLGGGLHPFAGHFISEHYVFDPTGRQETYSYYGPLNWVAWSVGYHNEHHDFPRIPGSRLHRVREIAPEYYEGLVSYESWSQVLYMYVMDRTVGPYSRAKRKPKKGSSDN